MEPSAPPAQAGPSEVVPGDVHAADAAGAEEGPEESRRGPARSVEGWVVIVRNLHEEASEEDLVDAFLEQAEADVRNLNMNLDRRTGLVKGYCLAEFATKKEAVRVIKAMDGSTLHERKLKVDWAFGKQPLKFY